MSCTATGSTWLLYTMSGFDSNHSAIGLATSSTAAPGSWTDQGLVYSSQTSDNYNAIDPALVVDSSGQWWLSFGSLLEWHQDDPDRSLDREAGQLEHHPLQHCRAVLARRRGSQLHLPARRLYYLFVSFDYCCRGVNSTYRIMVGRSTSPTGPYTDEAGTSMMSGGGTQILATTATSSAPAGRASCTTLTATCSCTTTTRPILNGTPELGINLLGWTTGGWPYAQ